MAKVWSRINILRIGRLIGECACLSFEYAKELGLSLQLLKDTLECLSVFGVFKLNYSFLYSLSVAFVYELFLVSQAIMESPLKSCPKAVSHWRLCEESAEP